MLFDKIKGWSKEKFPYIRHKQKPLFLDIIEVNLFKWIYEIKRFFKKLYKTKKVSGAKNLMESTIIVNCNNKKIYITKKINNKIKKEANNVFRGNFFFIFKKDFWWFKTKKS